MLVVILTHSTCCLHETNLQMKSPMEFSASKELNMTFTAVYFVEMMLKLYVHRWWLYWNEEMWWNLFDCAVLAVGLAELLIELGLGKRARASPQFIRSLRVVRVVKIFRVVRIVQFVKQLRLIIKCVSGSLVSLFWSLVLLAGISLLFAAVLVQQMSTALAEGVPDAAQTKLMYEKFGSVQRGLLSMFECISGGEDWGPIYSLASSAGLISSVCFLTYVFFVWLSLANIITAIFVDNALKMAKPDSEQKALEKRREDLTSIQHLKSIFLSMDTNNSSVLTYAELKRGLRDFSITSFFDAIGLDVQDVELFFRLLTEISKNDAVDMEAFVSGCLRMKGTASNVDVVSILHQTKSLGDKMLHAINQCNTEVQHVRYQLANGSCSMISHAF